jgi:anaerobic magnesium-protoporphyrin IX monomethyl ester cyclase
MHVILWDTRELDASKDFAGGFGVGQYPGDGTVRGRVVRWFYKRDRRPTALLYAHLAAIFASLGHSVEYVEDGVSQGGDAPRAGRVGDRPHGDLYVFCPSLITLELERQAIARLLAAAPKTRVLVVGTVASVMPEAFDGLDVTVVKGEAEQLLWRLDEVLARPGAAVQLGILEDLDKLPPPDWSPFSPRRFRIGYDFWQFPTALIQSSRGCTLRCNYCPYLVLDNSTRFRDPQAVVDEIRHDIQRWGFRSFKFRDPLFGLNRKNVFRLADLIGRLPQKIQFSIETRIDLLPPETLRILKRVGLTSITVGIETPDDATLQHYRRAPIDGDRQRAFIAACRSLGIRTVAGFLIGFPEDTEESIRRVWNYAIAINPTFANFNVVTPYPGTQFFEQMRQRIGDFDFSRYTVYSPVLRYEHLTPERVSELLGKCFRRFYFRWQYLHDNAALLWPVLRKLGFGTRPSPAGADSAHPGVPRPLSGLDILDRKGLRTDAPHHRDRAAEQTGDRMPD